MSQLDPESPVYNTVTIGSLPDQVDLEALQWSVEAMLERHEILRSTFVAVEGEPLVRFSQDL